jgi:hypothetical protein
MKSRKTLVFLFLLPFVCLIKVETASGWNNVEAHPAINQYAIEKFEQLKKADPILDKTSLNGGECWGVAWDQEDESSNTRQFEGAVRKKPLKKWIVDGGYSADEPEVMMGLRHFYDPTNSTIPWLTDLHGMDEWVDLTQSNHLPEIDAVTWAIDAHDKGDAGYLGVQRSVTKQDYSWFDAKKYFRLALADEKRDSESNKNYGKAWRAVGEVMHLMADMTVPAHVRNDGHMLLEPLERSTNWSSVASDSGRAACSSLNYNARIEPLMRSLASWTNQHFLSQDTIPLPGSKVTANGHPPYPSPTPSKTTGMYEYATIDGRSFKLAHINKSGLLGRIWYKYVTGKITYSLDAAVLNSQRSILIPTAIRACAQVINRFLPRFIINAKVYQREDAVGTSLYSIHGEVKQKLPGSIWEDEELLIKNGVYLVINGVATQIPKRIAGGNFNSFTYDFSAKSTDTVWLRYDLGGYIIESNKTPSPGQWHLISAKEAGSGPYIPSAKFGGKITSDQSDSFIAWIRPHEEMPVNDRLTFFFDALSALDKVETTIKWKDRIYTESGGQNVDMSLSVVRKWSPNPFPQILQPGNIVDIQENVTVKMEPMLSGSQLGDLRFRPKIFGLMETKVNGERLKAANDPDTYTHVDTSNDKKSLPDRNLSWKVPAGKPGERLVISFAASDSGQDGLGYGYGSYLDKFQSAVVVMVYEFR